MLRNAKYWEERAEEARNSAENCKTEDGQATWLQIPRRFDLLARSTKKFEVKFGNPTGGWAANQ